MRKKSLVFLLLAVALSVFFYGCTKQEMKETSTSENISRPAESSTEATTETTTAVQAPTTVLSTTQAETQHQTTPPVTSEQSSASSEITLSKTEQELFDKTNMLRKALGLYQYKINYEVCKVAREKAQNIIDLGYFDHLSPNLGYASDMLNKAGVPYKSAGENLAKGKLVPSSALLGWYNSPGHKEALLNESYKEIGIAVVDGNDGISYWVQIFIDPK